MNAKILFFDDIFSSLFRKEHNANELIWDDNWVSSLEKAFHDQNDRLEITFNLVKSGDIENWKGVIDKEKPDTIIMDYYWPEHAKKKYGDQKKGGEISIETIKQIRKLYPNLPIISYTIKPDRQILDAAYESGVTFFLEKIAMAMPEVHNTLKYVIIYLLKNKKN
jgi:DNA-binding NarL/FixJ family response regulator